jgi:hypothetical protein
MLFPPPPPILSPAAIDLKQAKMAASIKWAVMRRRAGQEQALAHLLILPHATTPQSAVSAAAVRVEMSVIHAEEFFAARDGRIKTGRPSDRPCMQQWAKPTDADI